MYYVFAYLLAVVLANVLVSIFGPPSAIPIAFFFVGFVLTTRDKLHAFWKDKNLKRNMFLVITTGAIMSYFLSSKQIAIASFVAFSASETVDFLVYSILGKKADVLRVNGSNLLGSLVDSIVFPALAFGFPLLWEIMIGQFLAKFVGGFFWFLVIGLVVRYLNESRILRRGSSV